MKILTRKMWVSAVLCTGLACSAQAATYNPGGGTDSNNYVLTENSQAQGNGTFSGTFNAGPYDLGVSSLTGNLTFGGVISGTAVSPLPNLTILAGAHSVILNGANTFSGDVVLESGTLQLGDASALGTSAGAFRTAAGSATLDLNGQAVAAENAGIATGTTFTNSSSTQASWGGNISISGANLTFNTSVGNIAVSGNVSGGGVIKTGAGVLTVSGDNLGLTAAWSVQQGTLKLGSANAVGIAVLMNGSGAAVDLNGQSVGSQTYQALANSTILNSASATASWNGTITLGAHDLTINTSAGDITANGALNGSGHIYKEGAEALTLTSTSTSFTGNLTINEGTVNFDGKSNFIIGASGINNAIDGTGSAVFDGTFSFDLTGAGTGIGNTWNIVAVASLNESWASNFSVFGFIHEGGGIWTRNNFGTHYQFSQTSGQLSVVPEPSAVALVGVAGLLLAGLARRRGSFPR